MTQMTHHYHIFEIATGFCGIAWNNTGITHFQLPGRNAAATEQRLRRRLTDAKIGTPTPMVLEAVTAVRHYFEGE